jgi:predicted metal-binding membrane protein
MTAATLERRRLPVAVPAAIALAWVAAVAAHVTGVADRFHHHALLAHGGVGLAGLAGYALVWCVMVAAMMLPSAVPLLRLFAGVSAGQDGRGRVLAWFVGGYLAVWALFGGVALAFDDGVHRLTHALPWLAARPWLVAAATLALAGAFQLSPLKDRCLTACRHPAAYLLRHYRRGPVAALRLGSGHGLWCLGCCWALMLVMFAAGVAALVLAALVAVGQGWQPLGG